MSEDSYTYDARYIELVHPDKLAAALGRIKELEGEVAALTNGRADLLAALQQSEAENAALRAGIANIHAHAWMRWFPWRGGEVQPCP